MINVAPLLAVVVAALVAASAWRFGALTGGGAVAATAVGAVALSAGGRWAVLVLFFFLSSSALSRLGETPPGVASVLRAGPRNAIQVAANGVIFAAAAVGSLLQPDGIW